MIISPTLKLNKTITCNPSTAATPCWYFDQRYGKKTYSKPASKGAAWRHGLLLALWTSPPGSELHGAMHEFQMVPRLEANIKTSMLHDSLWRCFLIRRSMRWINDAPGCSMFLSCLCLVALERVVWHGQVTIHYTSRSVFFIFDRLEPIQVIHGQHLSSWWTLMVQLGKTKQSTRSCKPWWILSPSLNITPQKKYNWSSDPHMDFRLQSLRILENWKPLIILYSVAFLKYLKCKQIIPPIPILSKHTLLARTCYNFLLQLSGWHWSKDCSSAQQEPSLIYIKSKYWVVLVGDIFFSLVCTVFHHKM